MGVSKTLWALALLLCCLAPALAAGSCADRRAACERTCKAAGGDADFQCEERGGAVSSSCACAGAGAGEGATSGSSSSSSSFSSATPGAGTEPDRSFPTPEKTNYTNCDIQEAQCKANCPAGAAARFDCDRAVDGSGDASAVACACVDGEAAGAAPGAKPGGANATSGTAGTVINGGASPDAKASEAVDGTPLNAAWSVGVGGYKAAALCLVGAALMILI